MTVAYDGTGYHGFAEQPGQETVAGALRGALARELGSAPVLTCAGRTDAGVHALGQVVHFDVPAGRADPVRLARLCNRQLAPRIVVRSATSATPRFDARRSALSRRYRYRIDNAELPDPLLARTHWWVPQRLDLAAMRLGTDPLLGEHDFSALCRRARPGADAQVRRVVAASWRREGTVMQLDIEANAFCQQMVRSTVGMMVRVGRGRLRAGEVLALLRSAERSGDAPPAPARGLCLMEVRYRAEDAG